MKKLLYTTLLVLVCTFRVVSQDSTQNISINPPLYVLKADDKTVEIDPAKNEGFKMEMLDSDWIKSVEVLTAESALQEYGTRGQNGVVIVQFKSYYILSKEVHALFEPGK
jgi:hypothetical protein